MKRYISILLLSFNLFAYAQDSTLRTYSRTAVDTNTCVFRINLINLMTVDSSHVEIRKQRIERLIAYLAACDPKYNFDPKYEDREFRLVIPKYLNKVSYELGDQHFAIVFRDTTSFERSIGFFYDLDDSYQKHFLSTDNRGFRKQGTVKINQQTIHRFRNYDDRHAGTIFTTNHLHVSYFTKSKRFEPELQKIISQFRW